MHNDPRNLRYPRKCLLARQPPSAACFLNDMGANNLPMKDQAKSCLQPYPTSDAVSIWHSCSWRRLGMACILTFSLSFAACSDRASEAAQYAQLSQAQLQAGKLDEARENVRAAIRTRDDVAEYFVLLGRVELRSGKLPSAFNAYSRALDLQADNLEILQAIAELGLQTGRITEAEEAADRMLLLFPGSPRALLVKGFLAIEVGDFNEAERFANALLAQNANDEGGTILAARLKALNGDFDSAAATVLQSIEANGETDALNTTLLEVYRAQGHAEGMREVFQTLLASIGAASDYQIDFVNFLYKTGDTSTARNEVMKAMDAQPDDAARLASLSELFFEYDLSPLDPSQLSEIARSGTRTTRLALARFYLESGQLEEAKSILAQPVERRVLEAQALMARIALAEGRTQEADRYIDITLDRDPRNPDALIARSARRLGSDKIDDAIEDANIVVSYTPQEYAGYAALANAYAAKQSDLRARRVFELGMDLVPQSQRLAERYKNFLASIDDRARIVSLYGDLATAKPSSIEAWQQFSKMCDEFGDRVCQAKVERGLARAFKSYAIDKPPGTPRARGLFARITPEQICRSSGGICTGV
ncbi:MAG: tetratricopeptide repeat protein [Pseudomonadota bacterium]